MRISNQCQIKKPEVTEIAYEARANKKCSIYLYPQLLAVCLVRNIYWPQKFMPVFQGGTLKIHWKTQPNARLIWLANYYALIICFYVDRPMRHLQGNPWEHRGNGTVLVFLFFGVKEESFLVLETASPDHRDISTRFVSVLFIGITL